MEPLSQQDKLKLVSEIGKKPFGLFYLAMIIIILMTVGFLCAWIFDNVEWAYKVCIVGVVAFCAVWQLYSMTFKCIYDLVDENLKSMNSILGQQNKSRFQIRLEEMAKERGYIKHIE